MASTYLSRTQSTSSTRTKCTLSAWIKRGNLSGGNYHFFVSSYISNSDRMGFYFNTGDTLDMYSPNYHVQTSKLFRDTNAWYHIVYRVDTTQATASDRIRIYVNGVQETQLGIANYPTQNFNMEFGTTSHNLYIGNYDGSNYYFDGCMSHVHFADGQSLEPSVFGSTDSTTGEWKINTSPSFTLGTNGFSILKDGNTITDQSSNSNNFSLGGGTLTKTEDCPSNIFATFNADANNCNAILSNGNTTVSHSSTSWKRALSNLGNTSGKWYWEVKRNNSNSPFYKFGMVEDFGQTANMPSHEHHADNQYGWAWYVNGGNIELRTNQAVISGYSQSDLGNTSMGDGDIICIALDLDNGRLHARKNDGSWLKSGDPAAGTGGYAIANWSAGKLYIPATSVYNNATCEHNFGNGYFGTTAVSSAGTNASNIGIFEFDVPNGFTAWSTKGLNE